MRWYLVNPVLSFLPSCFASDLCGRSKRPVSPLTRIGEKYFCCGIPTAGYRIDVMELGDVNRFIRNHGIIGASFRISTDASIK